MRPIALISAILLSAVQSTAAASQSADAFVRGIYRHYLGAAGTTGEGIALDDRRAFRRYFSPDIATIMIKDEEAARRAGEEGSLDFDPFVSAQDWAVTDLTIRITPKSASAADALVRFKNVGKAETITLILVRAPDGWRISDILWPDNNGTLRGLYQRK
jgi:hypothetical protein